MMYVLPPQVISLSLRSRLLQLRSPISTYLLANPWVIRPPRSSLPSACSSAASLSSRSRTRTRPYRASITMARRLPGSGHSGPYSSAAPQFMLVERSSRSTGSFLRLAETAGRISLRGVRFDPPVSAPPSLTSAPSFAQVSDPAEPPRNQSLSQHYPCRSPRCRRRLTSPRRRQNVRPPRHNGPGRTARQGRPEGAYQSAARNVKLHRPRISGSQTRAEAAAGRSSRGDAASRAEHSALHTRKSRDIS